MFTDSLLPQEDHILHESDTIIHFTPCFCWYLLFTKSALFNLQISYNQNVLHLFWLILFDFLNLWIYFHYSFLSFTSLLSLLIAAGREILFFVRRKSKKSRAVYLIFGWTSRFSNEVGGTREHTHRNNNQFKSVVVKIISIYCYALYSIIRRSLI